MLQASNNGRCNGSRCLKRRVQQDQPACPLPHGEVVYFDLDAKTAEKTKKKRKSRNFSLGEEEELGSGQVLITYYLSINCHSYSQ